MLNFIRNSIRNMMILNRVRWIRSVQGRTGQHPLAHGSAKHLWNRTKWKLLVLPFIAFCLSLPAQQTLQYLKGNPDFDRGVELFEKQKYAAARHFFEQALDTRKDGYSLQRADAEYYVAICAIQLFNDDAEELLTHFIAENSQSPRINSACFEMARYEYGKRKYHDAVAWFKKVDKAKLSAEDLPEYYFKMGYSYYMNNDLENARMAFFEIKDVDTKYTSPALYYYSHIAYLSKNYQTALEGFMRLVDDETFAPVVPYYIAQIYYLQGKYDELIKFVPPLLDKATDKRKPELAKLIGEAYYRKGLYAEALPYLQMYADKASTLTQEDKYELGYASYQTGNCKDAVKWLERVSVSENEMGQNALYHLGDCFLKLGDKNQARMSFSSASRLDFNKDIKEDALFNYAKLTYELSYSPFNEALKAFNEYLELYPNNKRTDEVYNYLVTAFLSTRNYQDALTYIQKIRNKTDQVKKAYQRVAFFRGIELFNNLDYNGAVQMFDLSLNNGNFDPTLKVQAIYWRAEALYRSGDVSAAQDGYTRFIESPGAYGLNEYKLAQYNLGYCAFSQKKYTEALSWFRKYLSLTNDARLNTVADAYNRAGDCYFVAVDYPDAITNYDKSIAMNLYDTDYALFQKGFSEGLLEHHQQKITTLTRLVENFPKSSYMDDALFELANSYMKLNQTDRAMANYQRIVKEYSSGAFVSRSLVQLGLIYYNQDKNQDAMAVYKKVVTDFPGTAEAQNALAGIKNIYVDMNDVDGYFTYVKGLGNVPTVSASEEDSLTYYAAENLYLSGDCDRSRQAFAKYIEKFPNGNFILNAQYYKGDCNYRSGEADQALAAFNYVIGMPRNIFTEPALLGAARINLNAKNYADAAQDYKELETVAQVRSNLMEARIGMMRCYYNLQQYQPAIDACDKVLVTEKVPDYIISEADFTAARCQLALNNTGAALQLFRKVAVNVKTVEGAESKYRVAEILYNQGEIDKAQKEIFNFIDQNTPHQYWMAKSFILLADIYAKKKDTFQALQTLKSILDYYDKSDDGILDTARQKKAQLESLDSSAPVNAADSLNQK